MKIKLSFILIIFLLLQVEVQAMNLGTLVKNTRSEVMKDDTTKFTILLWNSENSSFPIKLRANQVPKDLTVVINPREFIMNFSIAGDYSSEGGIQYINTPQGLMKTTPVDVLVKVPKGINLGEYEFYVNLDAGGDAGGISTVFQKTFKFNVKVVFYISKIPKEKLESNNLLQNINEIAKERITGMFANVLDSSYMIFSICLIVGVFLFLWRIYKHE